MLQRYLYDVLAWWETQKVRAVSATREQLARTLQGQGLVEYALIIVLVSIAVIVALGLLGDEINAVFQDITSELQNR